MSAFKKIRRLVKKIILGIDRRIREFLHELSNYHPVRPLVGATTIKTLHKIDKVNFERYNQHAKRSINLEHIYLKLQRNAVRVFHKLRTVIRGAIR